MPTEITPLVVGNWKMNGVRASLSELERLCEALVKGAPPRCTIAICPPATLLAAMSAEYAAAGIVTGGQDCHHELSGPYTGDISAQMLADAGAQYVIVGHSERRIGHGETDAMIRGKAIAAIGAGLVPIICVGETGAEREAGYAEDVVGRQLSHAVPDIAASASVVVAYEPVWAIGTGLTPTLENIAAMHTHIRRLLVGRFPDAGAGIRILYGGSLKPGNARDIFAQPDVNGGLVGGACLLATDFHAIISAV
jgi:triosephosphate isomerase